MAKETVRVVYFEDLSVSEILMYVGDEFCGDKQVYLQYGRNLREAWERLWNNENHYDRFCGAIDLEDAEGKYDALAKSMLKHLDPAEVKLDDVKQFLEGNLEESWLKENVLSKKEMDHEFKVFSDALYEHLRARFKHNAAAWNMKLERRKKG